MGFVLVAEVIGFICFCGFVKFVIGREGSGFGRDIVGFGERVEVFVYLE